MNKKSFLLGILFLLSNCTQNFISYIKTPTPISLVSPEEMLLEVGLINPTKIISKDDIPQTNYLTGTLKAPSPSLETSYNTIQIEPNSQFFIDVDIENYLLATPYYSTPNIIYKADQSIPNQGKLVFIAGEESGKINIRLYDPQGILRKEIIWYVEILK